jgi:N-acyl amino acid synthase of PEP-CTERM/exosortase system
MFDDRFEAYLADTAEGRSAHHRIRYQVFCLQRGYEDPANFPELEERDTWDTRSEHLMVRSKADGRWVAASRIVLPSHRGLPVHMFDSLEPEFQWRERRLSVGEASRVCVIHGGERNAGKCDTNQPVVSMPDIGFVSSREESEVLLGMIRAIIFRALERQLDHLYILVTRALARLLKRLGVVCEQAGREVEHRGLRAPYLIDLRKSRDAIAVRSRMTAELFSRPDLAYLRYSESDLASADEPVIAVPTAASSRLHFRHAG